MDTRRQLDKIESCEVDIAARLFMLRGTDEGPPTCPPEPPTQAELDAVAESIAAARKSNRKFIWRSMEACRLENRNTQTGGYNVVQGLP